MVQSNLPALSDYSDISLDSFFAELLKNFELEFQAANTLEDLEVLRIRWAGRKQGLLTDISERLKLAPSEYKKSIGQRFNQFKTRVTDLLDKDKLADAKQQGIAIGDALSAGINKELRRVLTDSLDITLPGTKKNIGIEHPLVKTSRQIVSIFQAMGYSVATGPEVETDYYNFESLNFPPNHPARDTQDTLVIADQDGRPLRERLLMRTHTSPVQIRTMESTAPPLRLVIPGKVYRNEAEDATHLARFQQVEGLCVDTNITFSDLKGTLNHAMKSLFGASVKTRFFPSFFPFTEPSADMQISCIFCGGKGCKKCKHSGWIELLGCGMVDPAVFQAVNQKRGFADYDPAKISGFAFGMGVERIAMMQYGVSAIGNFYSNDMRFLEQFA